MPQPCRLRRSNSPRVRPGIPGTSPWKHTSRKSHFSLEDCRLNPTEIRNGSATCDPFHAFRHTVEILTSFRLLREPGEAHTTYRPMPSPFEPHGYASSANDCPAKKSGIAIAMRVTGISGRIVQRTLNSSSSRRWRGVELQSCTSCFRAEGGFRV